MTWSPEAKRFVLDMPKDKLKQAPGLDKRKWNQEIDSMWLNECDEFFGCPIHTHTVVEEVVPVAGLSPRKRR
jgi:hypothetical protein